MRILFATTSAAGHFGPLVPFARACLRAGHEILVAGPSSAAPLVERARLPFRPLAEPTGSEIAQVREWTRSAQPEEAIERSVRDLYVRCYAGAALSTMLAAIEDWRPDLIVRESAEFASCVAAEHLDVPHARVGLSLSAQWEDRCLALAAPALDELRARLALPADPGAQRARRVPCLTLAPRSFEDPSAPEPVWVRRFRNPANRTVEPLPNWWEHRRQPLVYVSFGTEVPSPTRPYFPGLYRAAIHALAALPVRILVTIGDRRDPAELGPLPPSVHVERWIPQSAIMPHAAAMIGHGGAGSTLIALAGGVPMALLPLFADQPFNARRIAELGAGVALEADPVDAPTLADAARDLLDDPSYGNAAARMADEIGALPPVDEAVDALRAAVAA